MHPLPRAGVVVIALLGVVLTGCSSGSTPSAGATKSASPSAASSPSKPQTTPAAASPSTGGTPASTSASSSAPATPLCTSAHLKASLTSGGGAAGTTYYQVRLTNIGSATCRTTGYPGVSLVTAANGTQVGAAADRVQQTVRTVVLAPGRTATATLSVGTAENYPPDKCKPASAAGFRIYPPDETRPLYVAQQTMGCRNTAVKLLTVKPMRPA